MLINPVRKLILKYPLMLMSLLALTSCFGGADQKVAGPIDANKKISISFEPIVIAEGETKAFQIQLDKATTEDLSLKWVITGADAASRFQFTEGLTSISTSNTSVVISLIVNEDAIYNPDLSYTIQLEEVMDHKQFFEFLPQSFVVADNDPKPEVSFATATSNALENSGAGTIMVNMDAAAGKSVTISYNIEGASTATETTDYTHSGSFIIAAGSTSANLTYNLVDDADTEGNETVIFKINSVKYDAIDLLIAGASDTHTLTIVDDEVTSMTDPTAFRLVDRAAETGFPAEDHFTSEREILVEIDGDAGATKWCLSTAQTTKPVDGNAVCVGGAGASDGWYTSDPEALDAFALSADIQLPDSDASVTYYIWVANLSNQVNPNPVSATITLDRSSPSVTVAQDSTDPASSYPINFNLQFSEALVSGSFISSEVTTSGTALTPINGISTSDDSLFELNYTSVASNGTIIPSVAAGVAFDFAGNPNTISTSAGDDTITTNFPEGVPIYRSVGPGNLAALSAGTDSGGNNLTIDSNSVAIFEKSIVSNIGVGDALVFDSNDDGSLDKLAFVSERMSDKGLVLQSETGASISAMSVADQNWSIYRAYTSLFNAEAGTTNPSITIAFDSWSGGKDLVAANQSWKIALYADAADTSAVNFSGWTSGAFNRISIFVPALAKHVGVSQRHSGKYDATKYVLTQSGSDATFLMNSIEKYIELDGLQILSDTSGGGKAVRVYGTNFTLKNSIIKNGGAGITFGLRMEYSSSKVSENLIYNNLFEGFNSSGDYQITINGVDANQRFKIYNNSFVDCGTRVVYSDVSPVYVSVINNLAACTGTNNFSGSIDASSDYNISNDTTAPGGNSINSASINFNAAGASDYRLSLGDVSAITTGFDLSSVVKEDITGRRRIGSFDIGAFQSNLTSFTWTGAGGDDNWSTGANWHGGAAPSALSDVAIFNYLSSGSNSNIDSSIAIDSIVMESDYSGSLTQLAGNTLDLEEYFHVLGGSFIGGNSQITVNTGNNLYTKKWGSSFIVDNANFTSTSGKLQILYTHDYTEVGLLEMNPNAGIIDFNSGDLEIKKEAGVNTVSDYSGFITRKEIELSNLLLVGRTGFQDIKLKLHPAYQILVGGNFSSDRFELLDPSKISVKGDVELLGETSNSEDQRGRVIEFIGTAAQEYTSSLSSRPYEFVVNKSAGGVTPKAGTTDLLLTSLVVEQGSFTAPSGELKYLYNDGSVYGRYRIFDIKVAAGFIHNGGTLNFSGFDGNHPYFEFSAVAGNPLNEVLITKTSAGDDISVDFSLSPSPIDIEGNLTLNNFRLLGAVNLGGNLVIGSEYGMYLGVGSIDLTFNGTANQFVMNPSLVAIPAGKWTVNKPTGSLSIEETTSLSASGQDLDVQLGNVFIKGDFSVVDNLNLAAGTSISTLCNNLTYGSLTGTGSLHSGDTAANLNLSVNDVSVTEDNDLVFTVSADNFACDTSLTFDYASADSTAFLFDDDYTSTSGTATLNTGVQTIQITVPVTDDTFWEESENLFLNLSNASVGTITNAQGIGTIQANDSGVATHLWTGAGPDDLWSNTANWSGGSVPGVGDVAYFDSSCSSCDADIDSNISLSSLRVLSSYTGTITQLAGSTINIANDGWYQQGGSFVGGDSAVTINGAMYLNSVNYSNTSATTDLKEEYYSLGAGTRTLNNGLVQFSGATDSVVSTTDSFGDVTLLKSTGDLDIQGIMDVNGNLVLSSTNDDYGIDSGTLLLSGNLTGSGAMYGGTGVIEFDSAGTQTIDTSVELPNIYFNSTGTITVLNTLKLVSGISYNSGTLNLSSAIVNFRSGYSANGSNAGGVKVWDLRDQVIPRLDFNNGLTTDFNILSNFEVGDLNIISSAVNSTLIGNRIKVTGDVVCTASLFNGDTVIDIDGVGPQAFTNLSDCELPSVEVNNNTTVSFIGSMTICGDFLNNSSGTVTMDNSEFSFSHQNGCAGTSALKAGGIEFHDLTMKIISYASLINIQDDVVVNGKLTTGIYKGSTGPGKISLKGDWEHTTYFFDQEVVLVGSTDQRVFSSAANANFRGDIDINSTGGTVHIDSEATPIEFNGGFKYTSGSVDVSGGVIFGGEIVTGSVNDTIDSGPVRFNDVSFERLSYDDNTIVGTMYVDGDLTINNENHATAFAKIVSGTIELKGNYIHTKGRTGGATLKFVGDRYQKIDYAGANGTHFLNYIVDKTDGFVFQDNDVLMSQTGQNLDIQVGSYRMNGYDLTIDSALNIAASQELGSDCGTLAYGSLTGSGTVVAGITSSPNMRAVDTSHDEGSVRMSLVTVLDQARCDERIYFDFTTRSDTAVSPNDYDYVSRRKFFDAGRVINQYEVNVYDDTIQENSEQFFFDVTREEANVNVVDSEAVVTIIDNDISNFKWVGTAADGLWSNAVNWSGGIVPGALDVAHFDSGCGVNCNLSIDTAISVRGINLDPSFTGSITQGAGNSITTGTQGININSGTFTGSDSPLDINGPLTVKGGNFTTSNSTLNLVGSFIIDPAASFTNNSSSFIIDGSTAQIFIEVTGFSFDDLTVVKPGGTIFLKNDLTVNGLFDASSSANLRIKGKKNLYLKADANFDGIVANRDSIYPRDWSAVLVADGTGDQVFDFGTSAYVDKLTINKASGTLSFIGNPKIAHEFTYQSGTVDFSGKEITFGIGGCGYQGSTNVASGGLIYNDVKFSKDCGYGVELADDLTVTGNLYIDLDDDLNGSTAGRIIGPSGTEFYVAGDLYIGSIGVELSVAETQVAIVFNGSGTQNYTARAGDAKTTKINKLEFAHTGTVNIVNNLRIEEEIRYTSGTVNWNTTTLLVGTNTSTCSGYDTNTDLYLAGTTVPNVSIFGTHNCKQVNIQENLNITGNLVFEDSTIDLLGNTVTAGLGVVLEAPATVNINGGTLTPALGDGNFINNGGTYNP